MRIVTSIFLGAAVCALSGCNGKLSEEKYKTKIQALEKSDEELTNLGGVDIQKILENTPEGRAHLVKIEEAKLNARKFVSKHVAKESKKKD